MCASALKAHCRMKGNNRQSCFNRQGLCHAAQPTLLHALKRSSKVHAANPSPVDWKSFGSAAGQKTVRRADMHAAKSVADTACTLTIANLYVKASARHRATAPPSSTQLSQSLVKSHQELRRSSSLGIRAHIHQACDGHDRNETSYCSNQLHYWSPPRRSFAHFCRKSKSHFQKGVPYLQKGNP